MKETLGSRIIKDTLFPHASNGNSNAVALSSVNYKIAALFMNYSVSGREKEVQQKNVVLQWTVNVREMSMGSNLEL